MLAKLDASLRGEALSRFLPNKNYSPVSSYVSINRPVLQKETALAR